MTSGLRSAGRCPASPRPKSALTPGGPGRSSAPRMRRSASAGTCTWRATNSTTSFGSSPSPSGEPPVATVELHHDRERQPRGAALPGDQVAVAVEQRPVLDQLVQVRSSGSVLIAESSIAVRNGTNAASEPSKAPDHEPWNPSWASKFRYHNQKRNAGVLAIPGLSGYQPRTGASAWLTSSATTMRRARTTPADARGRAPGHETATSPW